MKPKRVAVLMDAYNLQQAADGRLSYTVCWRSVKPSSSLDKANFSVRCCCAFLHRAENVFLFGGNPLEYTNLAGSYGLSVCVTEVCVCVCLCVVELTETFVSILIEAWRAHLGADSIL